MNPPDFRFPRHEAVQHIAVLTTFEDRVEEPLDTALDELAIGIDVDFQNTPWVELRLAPDTAVRVWLTPRNVMLFQTAIQAALALKPLCRPEDHVQS